MGRGVASMKHPAVRGFFAILLVAVWGYVGYEMWLLERQLGQTRSQIATFDELARQASSGLAELRAAQEAYVAAGQAEDFWIGKVTTLQPVLKEQTEQLAAAATTPEAQAASTEITRSLEAFEQMNRRAVEYTRGGQRLLASDLIFTDGLEMLAGGVGQLEQARLHERAHHDSVELDLRSREKYYLAGAGAVGLLVLACLLPIGRSPSTAEVPEQTAQTTDALGSLHLRPEPLVMARPQEEKAPPDPPLAPPLPGLMLRDLQAAASLCTELTRVADARELTPLLERTASLLGATGTIVWMVEADGHALRPILAHGYSPQALSRIGSISCDDDYATAVAFRKASLEVVKGHAGAPGAIIAPMLTSAGCIGVMTAEIADGMEGDAARHALATLLAAQLSTLVAMEPVSQAGEPQLQANA